MKCVLYQKTPWILNQVDIIDIPYGKVNSIKQTVPGTINTPHPIVELEYKFVYHNTILDEYIFIYEHDGTYSH